MPIEGYTNGGEAEDGGRDDVGLNPTERPRRSSARKRRQKDNRLFGGTVWGRRSDENKDK